MAARYVTRTLPRITGKDGSGWARSFDSTPPYDRVDQTRHIFFTKVPARPAPWDVRREQAPHPYISKFKWQAEMANTDDVNRQMPKTYTIFGGSGFLGSRLIEKLLANPEVQKIRVGTRFPEEYNQNVPAQHKDRLEGVFVDITDRHNILSVSEGSEALINMMGVTYECEYSYHEAHTKSAHLISHAANVVFASRYIHISSVTSALDSPSYYSDTKFRGEDASYANFANTTVFRPGPMWGKGSASLKTFFSWTKFTPIYPAFVSKASIQPVFVGDVAQGIYNALADQATRGMTIDAVGPKVYTHSELATRLFALQGQPKLVLPAPGTLGSILGYILSWLPAPLFTQDHIRLLQYNDAVASGVVNQLEQLGVEPKELAADNWKM